MEKHEDRSQPAAGRRQPGFYDRNAVYLGDLHNHCNVSYGHGPIADAFRNARLQLDFVAITGHAAWPDMEDEPMPEEVREYHRSGFARLRERWTDYLTEVEDAREPGVFETFYSYEIHSFRRGDRTAVTPDPPQRLDTPETPEEFDRLLAGLDASRERLLLLPHHIGYAPGYRGIDWPSVTDQASPIVEIISMHGLAESDRGDFPYLHTMGPLDGRNTMVSGLEAGHRFGVVGSTDHHSAHPGSFGYGKTAVWAESLTREAIWRAIVERRTYALSGDRIDLRFSLNDAPMGSRIAEPSPVRQIEVSAVGGGAIDRIDIVKNRVRIARYDHPETPPADPVPRAGASQTTERVKLVVEVGWGEKAHRTQWDIATRLINARVVGVEPRFRGHDVVDPLDTPDGGYAFSHWSAQGDEVRFQTETIGNPTATTSLTQAICIEVEGGDRSVIEIKNGSQSWSIPLAELCREARGLYTAGFVSPAIRLHRLIPENEYRASFSFCDRTEPDTTSDAPKSSPADRTPQPHPERGEDWYYVRVVQRNGHTAWSSPIWVANR